MPDYQQGKIYKIECLTTGLIYIGSTAQKYLCSRLAGHVRHYNLFLENKGHYISSIDIIKNGNYVITLIKPFPCNSSDELYMEERRIIESIDCVNKVKRPIVTVEEHREYQRIKKQKDYDKHKERRKEERRTRYAEDEEYRKKQNEICKQYRNENKEKVAEAKRLSYQRNIDTAKEYRKNNKEKLQAYNIEYQRRRKLYLDQLKYYNI